MIPRSVKLACLAASIGMAGGVVASAPAAWAGGNSGSAEGIVIPFAGPFPGTVPPTCSPAASTDTYELIFMSGNVNKLGGTIEGIAQLVDISTPEPTNTGFVGHATIWFGSKGNVTVTYHGSNGAQTTDFHLTIDPHGLNVATLSCS
jgi:hypothetical protein